MRWYGQIWGDLDGCFSINQSISRYACTSRKLSETDVARGVPDKTLFRAAILVFEFVCALGRSAKGELRLLSG